MAEADMDAVWNAYPEDRRRDRKACSHHVAEALTQVSLDDLVAATRAYATESAGFTRSKVVFIDNWFRDGKWRRHVDDLRHSHAEAEVAATKRTAQIAGWVKARHGMCRHLTEAQVREALDRKLVTMDEAREAGVCR